MSILIRIILSFVLLFPLSSFSTTNNEKKYDVVAIGNAMVDIISFVSEQELTQIMPKNFRKSDTTMINKEMAVRMFDEIRNPIIIPGGSEANIVVNIASLGGKSAFSAIAANDEFGRLFKESLLKEKVDYLSPLDMNPSKQTALCFAFITPDKDRTFAVSAKLAEEITEKYIDFAAIRNSKLFYSDASNIDHGGVKSRIMLKALDTAKQSSTITAFNLNNNYYIETYRDEIISLLPKVNIMIGSEKEAKKLFKTDSLEVALSSYLQHVDIVIVTQGKHGAIIATKDKKVHIDIVEQKNIMDLSGAGDAFAAGFLYGYTHGYTLKQAGELGAKVAAKIIGQVGARPKGSLKKEVL